MRKRPCIHYLDHPVIVPREGCEWADTMVLNPAIFPDEDGQRIHMLFRATGPWPGKNLKGLSDPYPIFLGYASSVDSGLSWDADFSRPALAPALSYDVDGMYTTNIYGERVVNNANGCIEDPRVFQIEGEYYLTAACRMFPPGAYWEGDKRKDNLPDWAMDSANPFGRAASENLTTTVLYKLDVQKLARRDYDNAFGYVCTLTDGGVSDNRDVFIMPEKMVIDGKAQYVMLHRPEKPAAFAGGEGLIKPCMYFAAAERLSDFATEKATHRLLATDMFDWEEERVGASFPPLPIGDGEWLVSYHGKQLPDYGYTQSFMIIKEQEGDFPVIIHRLSERLIYAQQDWELPDKFLCPCIFTTGGIVVGDRLIMSYGAADQKIGIMWTSFTELVDYVREFDRNGNRIK